MNFIMYCPVCGANIKYLNECPSCGYEKNKDYEIYPSLYGIPHGVKSVSVRHQEHQSEQIKRIVQICFESQVKDINNRVHQLENQFFNIKNTMFMLI